MGRSGTALILTIILFASAPASAGPERPCPACHHETARVEGQSAGEADYVCRFCEVLVHVQAGGRERVSFRIAGERREFDLVGGARLSFPLPHAAATEDVLVPVGEAVLAAARGAGHPVHLPGHPVNLPGHPVPLPAAPVGLPDHPVRLPSHPVQLPAHPVGLPSHPVEPQDHPIGLPSHAVRLPGHPVGLPGHPVRLPGHPVGLPGHPMAMNGTVVLSGPRGEEVNDFPAVARTAAKRAEAPAAAPAQGRAAAERPDRAVGVRREERAPAFTLTPAGEGRVPACPPPSSSARTSSSFFSRR